MQDTELSSIKLREAVEAKLEKKLETNKDFEKLSNCLLEEGYDRISPTTLKRIWGYLSEDVTPRRHTLNQLSRFAGYADYDAFCSSVQSEGVPPHTQRIETEGNIRNKSTHKGQVIFLAFIAAGVIGLLYILSRSSTAVSPTDNPRVLHKGQTFATYDDFLPLFGITATESRHFQFIPGDEEIVVWSPQYHNPNYHNDGNPDSLMPTITEYWTPTNYDELTETVKETVRQRQKETYYNYLGKKQVRIVFMKDLFDSTFVFLGIYRFSPQLSDTTKMVWIRAADQCNLDNIPFVKNYGYY